MFDRFEDEAKLAMNLARQEARRLQHDSLDAEHILLGLLETPACMAVRVLEELGIAVEDVRGRVLNCVKAGGAPAPGQLPFTPAAKRVLESSMELAGQLGDGYIGTEHLLLGYAMVRESTRPMADVLGADSKRLLEAVKSIPGRGPRGPRSTRVRADATGSTAEKLQYAVELCDQAKVELVHGQQFQRAARLRDIAYWLREFLKELTS